MVPKQNVTVNRGPQFRVLTEEQIERIYGAAIDVLETVGAQFHHEEAIDLFRHNSEAVVGDKNVVRVPGSLVERALNSQPGTITLAGRTGKHKLQMIPDEVSFGTGSDLPFFVDRETGKRRRTRYHDVRDAAKIVDYLSEYEFFMSHGIVSDAPNPQTYDRHQYLAMLETCTKPMVLTSVDGEGLEDLWRMACLFRGGADEFRLRPQFVAYIEPISPLNNDRTAVEKLLLAAERGIPAMYTPCPSSGATAPATMAGMLVQSLAETLMAVALCYLKKPGTPLIMGGVTTVMDMMTTTYSYGAPELSLASAANTDIAKWLGLRMFSTGGCTDAKMLDEQCAIEQMTNLFYAHLSGANLVHDVGYIGSGTVASLDSLVLNNEMIGMVRKFCRGIDTSDDHMALDVIQAAGPGGEFLTNDHTYEHWKEWFLPKLQDRSDWDTWKANGSKTLVDRTREETDRILAEHEPEPIEDGVMAELKRIVKAADQRHS